MAGAGAHGSPLAERIMSVALLTVAIALFTLLIIVWRHARVAERA
jgi:hypothetical protein